MSGTCLHTDRRSPEPVTAEPPPLPGRAVMHQRWDELAYVHWRYDPAEVQRLLPEGVVVDTFDGSAWVGLIPFEMRNIALGPFPAVPYLGSFVEVNVRTYVVDSLGRRAVWFFSLDVPRMLPVAVARSAFRLPYCWAATRHTCSAGGVPGDPHRSRTGVRHTYEVTRRWPRVGADPGSTRTASIAFTVGDLIAPADQSDLDLFISARWGLLTNRRSGPAHGAVFHERWPLRTVSDLEIDPGLVLAAGLPAPDGDPIAAYSPGVGVDLGWLTTVGHSKEKR